MNSKIIPVVFLAFISLSANASETKTQEQSIHEAIASAAGSTMRTPILCSTCTKQKSLCMIEF